MAPRRVGYRCRRLGRLLGYGRLLGRLWRCRWHGRTQPDSAHLQRRKAASAAELPRRALEGCGEMRASSCRGRFCGRAGRTARDRRAMCSRTGLLSEPQPHGEPDEQHHQDRYRGERHREPQRNGADDLLRGAHRLGDLVRRGSCAFQRGRQSVPDERQVANPITGAVEVVCQAAAGVLQTSTGPASSITRSCSHVASHTHKTIQASTNRSASCRAPQASPHTTSPGHRAGLSWGASGAARVGPVQFRFRPGTHDVDMQTRTKATHHRRRPRRPWRRWCRRRRRGRRRRRRRRTDNRIRPGPGVAGGVAHTGGGRVSDAVEVGDEESLYEVEVTLPDGSQVDVQLDADFAVVGQDADSENDD